MPANLLKKPAVLSLSLLFLLAGNALAEPAGPAEYHVVLAGHEQARSHDVSGSVSTQDRSLRRQRSQKAKRPQKAKRARRRARRRLPDFYQLYSGPGYQVAEARRAWGTFTTVMRLREVCQAYQQQFPDAPPLRVHDLSRRRGGRLEPHRSHRTGRDVDLRLVLKHTTAYVKASPRSLQLERMWYLLRGLVQTGDVQYIFLDYSLQRALYRYAKRQGVSVEELRATFQYPRGRHGPGIIRHEPGHRDHIHVRFFRRPAPNRQLVASR